jgi:hypothetical protein
MPRKPTTEEILGKAFLSEADLEQLGLRTRKTSQNLRSRGADPLPYLRFGRSVRYPADAVRSYCERRTVAPEE